MVDIPVGHIANSHKGGPNELGPIIDRVKKFGFTGYIQVLNSEEEDSEGFIFFSEGDILLYLHRLVDGSRETTGQQASKKIYEDAAILDSNLEIHTGVEVEEIVAKLTRIPSAAATRRSSRRAVLAWGKTADNDDEDEVKTIRSKLEKIRDSGYDLDIYTAMKGEADEAQRRLEAVERGVKRLETVQKKLAELEPMLEGKTIGDVALLLHDLSRISEAEQIIDRLEKDIARGNTRIGRSKEPTEEVEALNAMAKDDAKEEAKIDKIPASEQHFIAKLHSNYCFDNFVVGNSNHFAHAASVAVAEDPATTYNPLFIWSGPGLGKTHLLNAIANKIMEKHPHMKISYFTTEQFIRDLVESMKGGKLDDFRRKYREADILIVDDVQFLADSERSQEEFFHTFNSLYTVDKQIVLASDRPPKEIATLKQRLVSRFEGGLIVEIQQPDFETRLAILKQKIIDKNFDVKEDVLPVISRSITNNIRELEGALNKVVAFSSFSNREVDADLAREVLKGVLLDDPVEEQEEKPDKKAKPKKPAKTKNKSWDNEFRAGHSYLVEETDIDGAVKLFKEELTKDSKNGMAVIRTNPTRVEKEHKVKHLAELFWLTDRESKKSKTMEPSLEKLMWEMSRFLDKNPGGILLLDGLDYLASANTFDAVTHFIRRMVDTVAETDGVLIISLSPDTLEKQQVKILEREMDVISLL